MMLLLIGSIILIPATIMTIIVYIILLTSIKSLISLTFGPSAVDHTLSKIASVLIPLYFASFVFAPVMVWSITHTLDPNYATDYKSTNPLMHFVTPRTPAALSTKAPILIKQQQQICFDKSFTDLTVLSDFITANPTPSPGIYEFVSRCGEFKYLIVKKDGAMHYTSKHPTVAK